MVDRSNLVVGHNPRLSRNYRTRELAEDIRANGLKQRIVVGEVDDLPGETPEVIAGHRRIAAISLGFGLWPDVFEKHFPKGRIPVILKRGMSRDQIEAEKCDHGNMVGLNHRCEVLNSVIMLREAGLTEKAIAVKLAGVLDTVYPLTADARKKRDAFDQKISEARGSARSKLEKDKAEWYLEYRRGIIQGHLRVYKCPDVVKATMLYIAEGEKPEGFEKVAMPSKLSQSQVKKLDAEHREDMKDASVFVDGLSPYTKASPGPRFLEAWTEVLEASAKKPNGKRSKALSAKEMQAELTDGRWKSTGFRKLTAHHGGSKDVKGLDEADGLCYTAELVFGSRDPEHRKLAKAFDKAAQSIIKAVREGASA